MKEYHYFIKMNSEPRNYGWSGNSISQTSPKHVPKTTEYPKIHTSLSNSHHFPNASVSAVSTADGYRPMHSQRSAQTHGAFSGARSDGLSAQMSCRNHRTDTCLAKYAPSEGVGQGLTRGESGQECGSLATRICRDEWRIGCCCGEGLLGLQF